MEILAREFMPSMTMAYLVMFLVKNNWLDKFEKSIFYSIVVVGFIEGFAFELELYTASLDHPTIWRIILSIIGYTARPLIISLVSLLCTNQTISRKNIIIYNIPCLINFCIMSTALFSPVAFAYNEKNEFQRGPLGYLALFIMVFYFMMLFFFNIRYASLRDTREKVVLSTITVTTIFITFTDTLLPGNGRYRSYMALCILLFFIMWQNKIMNNLIKYDMLTGLLTRAETMRQMEQCLESEMGHKTNALLMLDMDNLKQANDRLGHQYGDKALKDFAEEIKKFFKTGAICGRIGGDEFFVFLKDIKEEEIEPMLKRLIEQFEFTYKVGDQVVTTTASVGAAIYYGDNGQHEGAGTSTAGHVKSLSELYGEADDALYKSKAKGKHTYTIGR